MKNTWKAVMDVTKELLDGSSKPKKEEKFCHYSWSWKEFLNFPENIVFFLIFPVSLTKYTEKFPLLYFTDIFFAILSQKR